MLRRVMMIVRRELGATLTGTGQFYLGYLQMAFPRSGSIPMRLLSLVIFLIPLVFLFGHPYFDPWLKIVSAIVVMMAAIAIARDFVHHARNASYDTRPAVRGALIGLFPFYLAAVVALMWGLVETLPANNGNPWMVVLNPAFPQEFAAGPAKSRFGYTPDMAESLTRVGGLDFWCYGIQVTTSIVIAPIIEQISGLVGQPIAVARLWAWNELFMGLELIFQILSASMFIGIIADIALSVQNKIAMGEDIGADLGENFGVMMVKASKDLKPDDLEKLIKAQAGLQRIRQRTFTNLRTHLNAREAELRARAAEALGDWGDQNAAMILAQLVRNDPDGRVRTACAYALEDLHEPRTVKALVQALVRDESADVRTAARIALRGWAPKEALEPLAEELDHADGQRREEIAAALAEVIENSRAHEEFVPQLVDHLKETNATDKRCGLFETMRVMIARTPAEDFQKPERERLSAAMQTALDTAHDILKDTDDSNFPARTAAAEFLGSAARWIASAHEAGNLDADATHKRITDVLTDELTTATRDADGSTRDIYLRAALLDALGRLGGSRAVETLVKHIDATPEAVSFAAIEGLGRTAHADAVAALIAKLEAGGEWNPRHTHICHALGRLKDARARAILETHIDHTSAVTALGRIADAQSLPALLAAHESPKPNPKADPLIYRSQILRSIGKIVEKLRGDESTDELPDTAQKAIAMLNAELVGASAELLPAVAEALGRAQGVDAADALRKALKVPGERSVAVARGLAALDETDVLAAITDVLPDADQNVQGVILDALSKLEPGAVSEELMTRLHTSFNKIGVGAVKVLFSTTRRLGDEFGDRMGTVKDSATAVPRWLLARVLRRDGAPDEIADDDGAPGENSPGESAQAPASESAAVAAKE